MSESLLYDETEMWHGHPDLHMDKLAKISNISVDSDNGFFFEIDLKNSENIKEKTKNCPSCPENKVNHESRQIDYMKGIKPKNYTKAKNFSMWTDKENFLIHCRMLKIYVRHGMIVDKIHEIISFKQNQWLKKYICFKTQKKIRLKMVLKKTSINC